MKSILITGTNRGIGLEMVKQYSQDNWRVYAVCRDPESAPELNALANENDLVSLHQCDVEDENQINALSKELADIKINILLNNAGVYAMGSNQFGSIDKSIWLKAFSINTIAPLLMTQAFIEQLSGSEQPIVANVSSKVGSIDDNGSGGGYAYRSSKSAINQVTKSLSIDLAHMGIKAVALHPGWVQTDMGGPNALINTQESVSGLKTVLENLTQEQSGSFINYDGSSIPW